MELQGSSKARMEAKEAIDTPGNALERQWTQDGIRSNNYQPEQERQEGPTREMVDRPQTPAERHQVDRYRGDPEATTNEEQPITEAQAQPQ